MIDNNKTKEQSKFDQSQEFLKNVINSLYMSVLTVKRLLVTVRKNYRERLYGGCMRMIHRRQRRLLILPISQQRKCKR